MTSRVSSTLVKSMIPTLRSASSGVAPVVAKSCRHIATDRNYIRFRATSSPDEHLLDPFIGKWKEVSCDGLKEFMAVSGLPKGQQKYLRTAKLDLAYSKQNGQWRIDTGFQKFPLRTYYTFKLDEKFRVQLIMGPLMNCVVKQDGKLWLETYESITKPFVTLVVTSEVNGDKLTSVAKANDAVVKRIFDRV